jgi:glycyl-tRNA synthetase
MVVEMTSLQGIIGREYALTSGEDKDVAAAIYEHYLPQSADDPKPESKPGLLIGLADRLDSLSGLFTAGLAPTGNKDPFAQRRSALGLVGNLIEWEMDFDVQSALKVAAANLPLPGSPDRLADCEAFIRERLRHMLLDQGFRYDIVDAGIASQGNNPSKAAKAVSALTNWVNRPNWDKILQAYARCVRITRSVDDVQKMVVNPNLFQQSAEKDLYQALITVEESLGTTTSVDDLLEAFYPMIPTINAFFDDVLVMVDDQDLRENRLGLLHRITILAEGIVDLSKLEGF